MNRKKRTYLTAIFLAAVLPLTGILSGLPEASASASSLSVIEHIDTANNNGLIRSKYVDENGNEVTIASPKSTRNTRSGLSLPDTYDSREQGAVTPIRDQGVTGSCWAFAAIKALESDSILQNLSALAGTDYSESHLVWYTYDPLSDNTDPLYGDYFSSQTTDTGGYYNLGGNAYYASYILADWWGAVSEDKAPFSADTNQTLRKMIRSMSSKPDTLRTESEVHLKNMDFYDSSDISGIKEAVMEHGSVDVSVYFDPSNMYHTSTVTSAYESTHDSEDANHCVTIIGWDDSFNTFSENAPASGAWLIANNYGENYKYSTNGYYWLSYYDSSLCEICTFEAEASDKYDTNFQYDGIGWGDLYLDTDDISFANVFTNDTDSPRSIGAAGFYTASDNQPYKVEIYRKLTGSTPDSGTRIDKCTTYGTVEHSGYHTITLSDSIAVAAGETFSVVVTFYAEDGNTVYVPIEGASDPFGSRYSSKSGQSYVYSEGKWMDNTSSKLGNNRRNMNNVCLKALASTITDAEYEEQEESLSSASATPIPESPTATPAASNSSETTSPAPTFTPTASDSSGATSPSPVSTSTPRISAVPAPSSTAAMRLTVSPSSTPAVSPSPAGSSSVKNVLIVVKKKKVTLQKGKSKKIPIRVTPADSFHALTFRSKNKKIATINKNGKIKAKKKGTTRIIVNIPNGTKISIKVIVKKTKKK